MTRKDGPLLLSVQTCSFFALQHDLNENKRHSKIDSLDKYDNMMLTDLHQFWCSWVKACRQKHITLKLSTD